jgi:hypothetical protein
MSDQFDRTRDIVTPWERAVVYSPQEFGPATEALRDAVAGNPHDAARSMVAVVLRKRQEREARTARRELVAGLILGALLLALMGMALLGALLLTPRWVADDAVTAAVLTAGMLLGLNLRSRL